MAAQFFQIDLVPQYGGVVDGITVAVFNTGTTTYTTLYTDNTLSIEQPNPYILDGYTISFWLADSTPDCDIRLSGGTLGSSYFIEEILTLPGPIWENQHIFWYDYPDTWAYLYPYKIIVTTTNAAEWAPDAQEIIEEAYERVGVEIRTGYQFRTARRSLNILFQEWANRGINLWTIEEGSITLLYGQGTYDLPADTVDLLEFVIRQNSGSTANQSDIIIPRIPMPTYAAIPNKLSTGRPSQVWVNRQTPIPQINISAYS